MITRHKPSTLLYKRTAAVRERSSLGATLATQRKRVIGGERRFLGEQDSSSTTMRPTMGYTALKKRTFIKATAAMACMIPSYATMAVAARGDSPRNFPSYTTKRPYSQPAGKQPRSLSEEHSPLQVLQTLVRRLNEPVPLRASDEESSSAVQDKRRMAELADELVARYASLPPLRRFGMAQTTKDLTVCERSDILEFLATECCPSGPNVETAMDDYKRQPTTTNSNFEKLKKATTPIFEGLTDFILQQNAVTGMGFLVALREDLLSSLRYPNHEASAEAKVRQQRFKDLDTHLKSGVFRQWFVPGLLSHERITYDSTPAKIIEAIATKEAVHPMKSLDDLKERLGSSKRVFALFHPCLPNQPLVFVHVALLSHGLPSSMEEIMANDNVEQRPKVAAFYSISNGVKGLAGVGLGEYLLKESIHALKEELPSLQSFVTLSPIPKFRKWIEVSFLKEEQKQQKHLSKGQEFSSSLLSKKDQEALYRCGFVSCNDPFPWNEFLETLEETDFKEFLDQAKTTTDEDIFQFLANHQASATEELPKDDDDTMLQRKQFFVLRNVLLKLASSYLYLEKHRGKPLDKVCKFHVGNGAELHDLHFGADLSRGGLSNSYGLMVNYLYDMDNVSTNQANFESSGFVVPVSPGVRKWLEERHN